MSSTETDIDSIDEVEGKLQVLLDLLTRVFY